MKVLRGYLLPLALIFAACSLDVSSSEKDGDWPEMELSQAEISFGLTGGTDTVSVKNYTSWWFSYACNDTCTGDNYILPDDYNTDYPGMRQINGGWWKADVLKDSPNKVVITVNGVETCLSEDCGKEDFPRKAIIGMTGGDIFASFTIYQQQD